MEVNDGSEWQQATASEHVAAVNEQLIWGTEMPAVICTAHALTGSQREEVAHFARAAAQHPPRTSDVCIQKFGTQIQHVQHIISKMTSLQLLSELFNSSCIKLDSLPLFDTANRPTPTPISYLIPAPT